ncbi:hypothetical protein GcM3_111006 [Golovinomyces cichoracearum]|uniref:Uncharacterized protein n=1 Tax=Golovinomyces cichoracearum TaxID=62708 RepID=A0A420I8V5_9PEZI|nr:hypothetical protein GcM3_111006 [Golovinomyces cichoracearum]
MTIIERPLSTSQTSDQTIDDFPLPPGTPRLEPNNHEMQDDSVPEFDQNFRFPIINQQINQDELNDPELTCQRLRNEVETMAARLALDFTGLESTRTTENPENYQSSSHCRYNTSYSHIRPKTSHGRVEAPRFPFGDFAEWDLKLERDEINEPENVIEDKAKPNVPPRLRASSLHSCRNRRPMKKAEFIIPAHARKFIIAQERARVDRERAAAAESDDILCQTREAVHHISEAGFDFGFGETDQNLSRSTADSRLNPANLSETEPESNIIKTVVKLPKKVSPHTTTEVHTHNSQSLAWPRSSDSLQWSSSGLTDSGIALASPNFSPNSAPPYITTFSDLPEPLRLNSGTKNIPSSNLERNYVNLSTRELSCWSTTPDLIKDIGLCPETNKNLNSDFPVHGNVERRKWIGFWGRMKNSMFSKKRSTSTTKATLRSPKQ